MDGRRLLHSFIPVIVFGEALLIFGLAFPQTLLRRWILAIIISSIYLYCIAFTSSSEPPADYGFGSVLLLRVLSIFDFLILSRHPSEIPMRVNESSQELNSARYRIERAIDLAYNPRGIGWNFGSRAVRLSSPQSRVSFVLARIVRISICYLIIDVRENVAESYPNAQEYIFGTRVDLASISYLKRPLITVLFALYGGAAMDIQFNLLRAAAVTFGFGKPADWPDNFGSPKEAYTIKRFWGYVLSKFHVPIEPQAKLHYWIISRTWHQNLRKTVLSYGKLMSRILHIPTSSSLFPAIQVIVAFSISAAMHTFGGDYMAMGKLFLTHRFFLWQPVGIAIEYCVAALSTQVLSVPEWSRKLVGYMWVIVWFSWCGPELLEASLQMGLGDVKVLPISVVRGVLQGKWIADTSYDLSRLYGTALGACSIILRSPFQIKTL